LASLSVNAGGVNPHGFYEGSTAISGLFYNDRTALQPGLSNNQVGHTFKIYGAEASYFAGRVLKDFHKRKASGELLPYTKYYRWDVSSECTGQFSWDSAEYRCIFRGPGPYLDFSQWWEPLGASSFGDAVEQFGVDPRAEVQRAAAKLYSQGWDALTFAAEFHKTVRMFRGALKSFIGLMRSLKKDLDKANPRDFDKVLSAWLEGRYGWRILLYDIEDINNLIRSLDEPQIEFAKERVGHSYSDSSTESLEREWGWAGLTATLNREVQLSVRGTVIADFVPDRAITNLAVTGWELTRFSFVVDWFYNVGQALAAMSVIAFAPRYTAAYGLALSITRTVTDADHYLLQSWPQNFVFEQDTSLRFEGFHRWPCTVPLFPSINVNLNAFKVADLLALMGQLVVGLFTRRG
jgi:hypothetical protein